MSVNIIDSFITAQVNQSMRTSNASSTNKENVSTTNFGEIFNKELDEKSSIGEFVKNIEQTHNAKINVTSSLFSEDQISGLNNVIIGGSTLERMKSDPAFNRKIMKIIDDVCSPEALQEVRSLAPPVKSAGVIIYPDGSCLYWLESAYSDREEVKTDSDKKNPLNAIVKIANEDFNRDTIENVNYWVVDPNIRIEIKKDSK